MTGDGQLQLGVNQWPDGSPPKSSPGRIPADANGQWFLHIGDTGYRYVAPTETNWQAYFDQAAEMGATKVRVWFCQGRHDVQDLLTKDQHELNLSYWHATYGGLRTYEPYDGDQPGVQGYHDARRAGGNIFVAWQPAMYRNAVASARNGQHAHRMRRRAARRGCTERFPGLHRAAPDRSFIVQRPARAEFRCDRAVGSRCCGSRFS